MNNKNACLLACWLIIVSFRQQCMIVPGNHALLPKAYEEGAWGGPVLVDTSVA